MALEEAGFKLPAAVLAAIWLYEPAVLDRVASSFTGVVFLWIKLLGGRHILGVVFSPPPMTSRLSPSIGATPGAILR
jgi:hypothetical protein